VHALFDRVLALQESDTQLPARLREDMSRNAHAAASPLHGIGVFASKDLAAHTVTALYPVHALGIGTSGACTDDDGAYFAALDGPSAYRLTLPHHCLRESAMSNMWCDSNPQRAHVLGWLGHLANDAAVLRGTSEEALLAYYAAVERDCNSMLVPFGDAAPLMALVTMVGVAKGDELLVPYGHSFWQELHMPVAAGDARAQQHKARQAPPPHRCDYSLADAVAKIRLDAARMEEAALAVRGTYGPELRELGALLLAPV
jgi:hypothetical protein